MGPPPRRPGTANGLPAAVLARLAPLALVATPAQADAQVTVEWEERGGTHVVVARGIAPASLAAVGDGDAPAQAWRRVLPVRTRPEAPQSAVSVPPMAGRYAVAGKALTFTPRFPLTPGVAYRATFFPGRLPGGNGGTGGAVSAPFTLPATPPEETTTVAAVYPGVPVLPENLLKFYLRFSAPMSRGDSYTHITLARADGTPVELPFLELDEELWNPEMTRLTLFIDPGRIKRGVRPLEEIGPALEEGRHYVLRVAREWRDARGAALAEGHAHRFTVGPPDRRPPDPQRWRLQLPAAGTREPLVVRFGEPLDHALALRMIGVAGADGSAVTGESRLEDDERTWVFEPDRPWAREAHRLTARAILEDLAGNNIGKPFEVDLEEAITREIRERVHTREWSPRLP